MGHRTTKTNHKVKVHKTVSCRIDFFYYAFRNVLLVSIPLLIVSSIVLSHLSLHSSATGSSSGSTSSTDSLSFSISSSCTLSSVVDSSHNAELINGTYVDGIGQTTITTLCNDGNGYSIYANGYSNNEEGNNKLVNTENSNFNIISGTAESGTTSNWAMSLNNLVNDPSLTPPTIEDTYNNTYGIVPTEWTKVASLPARATDMIKGSSFTTTYAVYTSSSQYAGTYNGQVKYVLTHPNSNAQHFFMQNVAEWKDQMVPHEGDSIQAIDERDGKSYWVTRLADGNVWMTQNLDFDIEANTILDSNTTDLNVAHDSDTGNYREYLDGYTENNGIIYYAPASTVTTIDFTGTNVPGWQNSNTAPYTANKTDSTETGHTSLGNYYNWTAAIASNDSSSLTTSTYNSISNSPRNSICPRGWRLPTISNQSETLTGSTNEFARLSYLYNNQNTAAESLATEPFYAVAGGSIYGNNFAGLNTYGDYWSSTVSNNQNAYFMSFNLGTGIVKPGNDSLNRRFDGFSIRCVAR